MIWSQIFAIVPAFIPVILLIVILYICVMTNTYRTECKFEKKKRESEVCDREESNT